MKNLLLISTLLSFVLLAACNDNNEDPNPQLNIPETYEFTRNGSSSVSYSGQTARMDMLAELKAYIETAHSGAELSEEVMLDMYANTNNPFSSAVLNESGKSLESKTFIADVNYFQEALSSAALASIDVQNATNGQAGLVARSNGNILVDAKGHEYTQIVEKGLMGAVFLHQIYNVYLTDSKIGNDIENEALVEGKNYTAMEHHWDEAFGYWGVPADFDMEGNNRFWAKYSNGREALLGNTTRLKDAFLTGRAAIVAKKYDIRDAQRDIIYTEFELVAAATAVHYINSSISDLNNFTGEYGDLFHHASEAYAFTMALKYSPFKAISNEEIDAILNTHLGSQGNFWEITLDGLQSAKATLISAYPELEDIADQL